MSEVISARSISKIYRNGTKAVQDLTLSVEQGEIYGFLGPNGAGKTTSISILTTMLLPTSGSAEVKGIDVVRHPSLVRKRIGIVFQQSTADANLTGRENLRIAAGLYGLSPSDARPRIESILDQMELSEAADRRVITYSGGMKRKLEIAAAIVHQPDIIFMDEPTLGLDPQGRSSFWKFIRRLREEHQLTIFLTTHYLDEADALCDRLSIIDHGSTVRTGDPDSLKNQLNGDIITISTGDGTSDLGGVLRNIAGVISVERTNHSSYRLRVPSAGSFVPLLVRRCDEAGVEVGSITTRKPSLEEVFISATGRAYREDAPESGQMNGVGQ